MSKWLLSKRELGADASDISAFVLHVTFPLYIHYYIPYYRLSFCIIMFRQIKIKQVLYVEIKNKKWQEEDDRDRRAKSSLELEYEREIFIFLHSSTQ